MDLIRREDALKAIGDKPPIAWQKGEYEEGLQTQWESDREAIISLPAVDPKTDEMIAVNKEDFKSHCIDGKTKIWLWSPTESAVVYRGLLIDLHQVMVSSPHVENFNTEYETAWVTLDEIVEQFIPVWRAEHPEDPRPGAYEIITVITSSARDGDIYMYDNQMSFWEKVGKHKGYA